jgi:hypothetical protein
MHSAIVYVVFAESPYQRQQQSGVFLANISKLETAKSIIRLGDYVWQISFLEHPGAFAQLVAACEQQQLIYGILPLADEPRWIPGGSDPRSIQAT